MRIRYVVGAMVNAASVCLIYVLMFVVNWLGWWPGLGSYDTFPMFVSQLATVFPIFAFFSLAVSFLWVLAALYSSSRMFTLAIVAMAALAQTFIYSFTFWLSTSPKYLLQYLVVFVALALVNQVTVAILTRPMDRASLRP